MEDEENLLPVTSACTRILPMMFRFQVRCTCPHWKDPKHPNDGHEKNPLVVGFQMLLILKTLAAILSGSLSIISAVIDSGVDLVSGALMWWSNRAMKYRDPYTYPQGSYHA